MPYLSLVIVNLLGCHFDVPETVGAVQRADGIQVPLQILAAVAPVPVADQRCRNYIDPFSNCVVVEIVIAVDLELDEFVDRPAVNVIIDQFVSVWRKSDVVGYPDIKITLGLEVCSQVARAFQEQILVHGPLLIKGQ